uniref:Uncharacterized protein n=1 Tax=Salmo trutta TaxID=8032 RepID=A0A674AD03_SALTR
MPVSQPTHLLYILALISFINMSYKTAHFPLCPMMDLSLRQSLSRQWESRRLLQRCFSGTMQQESTMPLRQNCLSGTMQQESTMPLRQNCLSGTMQQEATMQLRPPQICLRGCTQPGPLHPQEVVCFISGLKRAIMGVGVRRDPTPVWSTVVGFTKLPRALGWVVSRETQRG